MYTIFAKIKTNLKPLIVLKPQKSIRGSLKNKMSCYRFDRRGMCVMLAIQQQGGPFLSPRGNEWISATDQQLMDSV